MSNRAVRLLENHCDLSPAVPQQALSKISTMAIANDMSERQRFRRAFDPGGLGGLSGALLGVL